MNTNRNQTVDRFVAGRDDVGPLGVVDGGTLLGWLADAAEAMETLWSSRACVVRSVGDFHLDRAISIGERVLIHTCLVYTRGSEMHVVVTVRVQRPGDPADTQMSQCAVVLAAVDGDAAVPQWAPVTMLDLQRHRQARLRSHMSARIERAIAAQSYTSEGTALQSVSTFHPVAADGSGRVSTRRLLAWIDDAVCGAARSWTGDRTLTSFLAGLHFYGTIGIDDVVTVSVRIIHTGPRSAHIGIRLFVDGSRRRLVARGVAVAVVPDENGRARPLRQWRPGNTEDRRLDDHARQLIELRQYLEPGTTVMAIAENAQPLRLHRADRTRVA